MKLSDIPPDEFAHFGVKGQKWGVRKKEESAKSAPSKEELAKREKKAEKFDTRANMYQTRISQLQNVVPRNIYQKRAQNQEIQELTKARDQAIKDAEAKRNGKLSRGQKQAIGGAIVVASIITAVSVKNMTESGDGRRKITKAKAFLQGKDLDDILKKNPALSNKDLTAEAVWHQVARPVNPNYGDIGTKQNCRRATLAYEMRRRGYDVEATRTTNARGQTIAGMYNALTRRGDKLAPSSNTAVVRKIAIDQAMSEQKGREASKLTKMAMNSPWGEHKITRTVGKDLAIEDMSESIFKSLVNQPNGARGELGVGWKMGGGHSVAWEIIDGKPVIFDCQSKSMMSSAADFAKQYGASAVEHAGITRLDDKPLNQDFLLRWVKNAR